jgi:N6-adenosine-specific RNA methylase IME4
VIGHGAILADPPWAFRTWRDPRALPQRVALAHYATSPTSDIAAIYDVPALAAADAALFLWTVDSHLDQGIELMRAWGFAFKTVAFVWVKLGARSLRPKIGTGLWTRKETELFLLGTRGHPRRRSRAVRQLIEAPVREHSQKPDEVHADRSAHRWAVRRALRQAALGAAR